MDIKLEPPPAQQAAAQRQPSSSPAAAQQVAAQAESGRIRANQGLASEAPRRAEGRRRSLDAGAERRAPK
ncbi:hypothetical protein E4U53_000275 [Claviceps sorghi]|nr:hypothetical protein E4U53_000275 [Claviceps sorghi]